MSTETTAISETAAPPVEAGATPDVASDAPADRLQAAMQKMQEGDSEGAAPSGQSDPPAAAEETKQVESRTDLYEKIAQMEAELREAKKAAERPTGVNLDEMSADDLLEHWMQKLGADAPAEESAAEEQTQESAVLKKIEELNAKLEAIELEKKRQSETAQRQGFFREIDQRIEAAPEKYPLLQLFKDDGAYDLVLQTGGEYYKLKNKVPDETHLLDHVEAQLAEYYKGLYEKAGKVFGQKPPVSEAKKVESIEAQAPSRTLEASAEGTPAPRELTQEERLKRALAAMESA